MRRRRVLQLSIDIQSEYIMTVFLLIIIDIVNALTTVVLEAVVHVPLTSLKTVAFNNSFLVLFLRSQNT